MVFQWLSLAAATAERKIRSALARIIADSSPPPKRAVRQVLKSFDNVSSFVMVDRAFTSQVAYTGYPEVVEWMRDNSISTDYAIERADIASRLADSVREAPSLAEHIAVLTAINNALEQTDPAHEFHISYLDFARIFNHSMQSYVHQYEQWYEHMNFISAVDFGNRANLRSSWFPESTNHYRVANNDEPTLPEEHRHALNVMFRLLENPNIPDRVVVHVLSESFGNAGLCRITEVKFPLFMNLFPLHFISKHRDDIWEKRKEGSEDSDGDPPSPSDVDDKYSLRYAEYVRANTVTADFAFIENKFDDFGDPDTPYVSETEDQEHDDVPPPPPAEDAPAPDPAPPAPTPQPTDTETPDDDNYVPDPFLSRKVRDLTALFQAMDEMDMSHDHMTRFSTNNEQPNPLSKWQVLRSDSVTFRGQSTLSQKFVVTYTRKSRKPVFNPVF